MLHFICLLTHKLASLIILSMAREMEAYSRARIDFYSELEVLRGHSTGWTVFDTTGAGGCGLGAEAGVDSVVYISRNSVWNSTPAPCVFFFVFLLNMRTLLIYIYIYSNRGTCVWA